MNLDDVLRWAVPALVVVAGTAILIVGVTVVVRALRRGTRARRAAEVERTTAGSALLALDDAVGEIDIDVALSSALHDDSAPPALRQARLRATHVRDDAFEAFAELTPHTHPARIRRVSRLVQTRAETELAAIGAARREHEAWLRAHADAPAQVDAARTRCRAVQTRSGDPRVLLDELAERFDADQWQDAARAAAALERALGEADGLLDAAASRSGDPTQSALPLLADAERRIRIAEASAVALELHHRTLLESAQAVRGEIAAARDALRRATVTRGEAPPDAAERLGAEIADIDAALTRCEADAARRPASAVDEVDRLRDRLRRALGDAQNARDRLSGARSALPGALSSARAAIAHAEPDVRDAGLDARVRFAAAQRELATAHDAHDPVDGLDAARRAHRLAEDAAALAAYDRLERG